MTEKRLPSCKPRRYWLLVLLSMSCSLLLTIVALETLLRFLPVASGLRSLPVNPDNPLLHYTPNRDFTYSRDWNFNMVNRGHVNNAGFVNDQDYVQTSTLPLLAVIGDSYIQAQMVPFRETLHGRLAIANQGGSRVYSFGASGAPLSQYVVYARHALEFWGADALVVNVVGNDFDESHVAYKSLPGFWYYAPAPDGSLQLSLAELQRGFLSSVVQQSALARYLVINLGLNGLFDQLRSIGSSHSYAGQTSSATDASRVAASEAVLEAFLRDMKAIPGLTPDRVLFTLDGFRYKDAEADGNGSYFALMRSAFLTSARRYGFEVIDLDPRFFAHHQQTGEHFEFPMDGHWNGNGHRIAFEAVMNSRLLSAWPATSLAP